MNRRNPALLHQISWLLIMFVQMALAANVLAGTWEIGILDSDGNTGQYCELQINGAGNMYVVYFESNQKVLKTLSRIDGVWLASELVDPSGNVAGQCAIAVDGEGVRRVSYQRNGMLWFAGPEASDSWSFGSITASPDDVGRFLSLNQYPSGILSLSCLDNTQGSLLLITRDALGTWSTPTIVDPGPSRGQDSDHAYRPGVGYSFTERDASRGMLIFADPEIHADEWAQGTVYASGDAGKFVSLARMPNGNLASTFFHYDKFGQGAIYMVALDDTSRGAVTVAVDSIAIESSDGIYLDLAIDQNSDWHICYRNALQGNLWYGHADSSRVTGVDDDGLPSAAPEFLELAQNFPNPFNPQTTITFSVPRTVLVNLSIYDATGRLVRTLANEPRLAGGHSLAWNGRDNEGKVVASGIYFMKLSAAGQVQTRKIVLLR